jgi:hypothetical protein
MRSTGLLVAGFTAAALVLAGCSSDSPDNVSPPAAEAGQDVANQPDADAAPDANGASDGPPQFDACAAIGVEGCLCTVPGEHNSITGKCVICTEFSGGFGIWIADPGGCGDGGQPDADAAPDANGASDGPPQT